MTKNAISVRNLTKTYKLYNKPIDRLKEALNPFKKQYHKNFNALRGVSFEIKRGETVGIIGRNGSGKSTLLKLITGVLNSSSGRVIVHGRISAILELGAGFNGNMTGLENIHLNNTINGIPDSETAMRVKQIVEFAELDEFIDQPIKTYSSGMKARLAFAIAINVEPDILIVDEALSVGDAAFQRKCFSKMEEIRQAGATILFVSHSEASIVSLCSRAILLVNGSKVLDGEPKLITSLYLKHINNRTDQHALVKEYEALSGLVTKSEIKVEDALVESSSANSNRKSTAQTQENIDLSSFNPNLKPTSTVEYESKGVRITDAKVTTILGKNVNILKQGEQYTYSYKVIVYSDQENVHFGMHMKDVKGNVLAGSTYPSKKEFISLKAGEYTVSFRFVNLFNSKEIFCSAGVRSSAGDFLHRIQDNYFFMVIEASEQSTGFVNLVLNGDLN